MYVIYTSHRTTMDEYIDYHLNDAGKLTSKIDNNKPTVVYIHGWSENLLKESVKTVVEGIFP